MPRALLAVASIALTVFALADCIQTEDSRMRGIPKWAWIILVVLIPWAGPITWLLVGKDRSPDVGDPAGPSGSRGRPAPGRSGPLAPDEDPEFLRRLDEQIRRERREREQRDRHRDEGPGSPA